MNPSRFQVTEQSTGHGWSFAGRRIGRATFASLLFVAGSALSVGCAAQTTEDTATDDPELNQGNLICAPSEEACTSVLRGCLVRVTLASLGNGHASMVAEAVTHEGAPVTSKLETNAPLALSGPKIDGVFLRGGAASGMVFLKKESSATYVGNVLVPVIDSPLMTGFKARCSRVAPSEAATCTAGGRQYAVGESFPDADGCNTCKCRQGGLVACTEMPCR
jgi:hypothetical protein